MQEVNTTTNGIHSDTKTDQVSPYLKYNHEIVNDYDSTRLPVGLDYLQNSLKELKKIRGNANDLSSIQLLEIACGSGNYLTRLANQVDSAYGIDLNQAMLDQCRAKLDRLQLKAELVQARVPTLPFDDQQFDIIYNCQMLHHLSGGVTTLLQFFVEINRVLKDQGMIIINFTTKEQIDSYWYMDLIPRAKQLIIDRCFTLDQVRTTLTQAGLVVDDVDIIYDTLQQQNVYLDPAGPLSVSYRNGDSTWSKATLQEVQHAEFKLKQMLKLNTALKYVQTRDQIRQKLGQSVMIRARAHHD